MAKLPYSRVTNVTLTRTDNFPTRRGFGTQLILTHTAVSGQVDATKRTKLYASLAEVEADYPANTSVYKAALSAFSQNPRPIRLKVGYAATPTGGDDAAKKADFITSLGAILNYDQAFYQITLDAALRDQPYLDGLVEWVEAQPKIAMIDSNAAGHEDPANTTVIAARHKGTVERTAVFYHTDSTEYLAASMAAYMSTRVFDDANSAYTLKFKKAPGVRAIDKGSAVVTAITGFVEQTGQSESAGHCANTLIDIGDQEFLVEGSTLTQNVFLDEIHATDWIIARTEEEMLSLFLNNDRVPFTDQGMQQLASVPRAIMQLAARAGIVALDLNPLTGAYEPAYTITVPSVFDIPESQRKARIAPAIQVRFRYAGAVHYSVINYTMTF
ncbi:shealth protein [Pseudanabaena phage Pam3]|uniref:Shealth protein n=1 Tax=Pseudanabaena phage Pam3 TaxID=2936519 RepID=A0ACD6BAM8_9CAUD|nr:Chain M, Pam3 sheath protein [uncultured cyanophage]8HDR_N Chain N, Pam3 sheath protein [uncultured cyanophage]8HDR_O Chain O, Pam3 sheath protein [uncultured cyanophage]8HDR_P Chain P, Pam3 sheath protein [uncultured cyanophage]8HDR_Q Chain Q, Pam3 sheath protein [uncultured cyanophage]8HDR_R Chain R, Pam3 sheath protein [uncultured cyanophage]8HDR_S Chain S, Pam3 sheath protein [uncultured cyanophage]8HDR_T Chain T, Pam3 sheath protein [uncultured cyanophage]8HDR_U Chain U, Pam3 sheath